MNLQFRIIAWSVCAALPVTIGCDDKSETAIVENLQVEPIVFLEDIPEQPLSLPQQSEMHQDLSQSLALLSNSVGQSNNATEVNRRQLPIAPTVNPGVFYGDEKEYQKMMIVEETPLDIDRISTDPTTNEDYQQLMEEEVRLYPDDFDGIYSWAGPEVEGYEEVIKSMPADDPTYRTPEQKENDRLLVETDVTDEYLGYHRRRQEFNRKERDSKKDAKPKIPNIQEYIRAKRNTAS